MWWQCLLFLLKMSFQLRSLLIWSYFSDMLNHSFEPNCFFHWRFKDRMLEVLINAGQQIRKGDEVNHLIFL